MKPNEFDELIRRKFDQNEFEYNPANWDRLDNRMDKKATRRKILMWLPLAPVAYISSVAASLAMIITIPVLMQHSNNNGIASQHSAAMMHKTQVSSPIANITDDQTTNNTTNSSDAIADNKVAKNALYVSHDEKVSKLALGVNMSAIADLNNQGDNHTNTKHNYNNSFGTDFVYGPDYNAYKGNKYGATSISVIGGFNRGSAMNGYSIGANGKKMLNDKVYIESDIAFVDNSGIQNIYDPNTASIAAYSSVYPVQTTGNNNTGAQTPGSAASMISPSSPSASNASASFVAINMTVPRGVMANARVASEPVANKTSTPVEATPDIHRVRYDLYYAQVTPGIGYHLHKNLSVGVGADVQRLLEGDDKMSTSTSVSTAADLAADNKLVPGFDVGLVGKTEVTLTDKIKASVYYRQGMNNVISQGNKYLDRSYLQVHLRFTLFGK